MSRLEAQNEKNPLLALSYFSFEQCFSSRAARELPIWNQISASFLQVLSDGTIKHIERIDPKHEIEMKELSLNEAQLNALLLWITDASQGELIQSKGKQTNMGSMSGELIAFSDGRKISVHLIGRGDENEPFDRVTKNNSLGALEIESLINKYVRNKMHQ